MPSLRGGKFFNPATPFLRDGPSLAGGQGDRARGRFSEEVQGQTEPS